VADYLKRARIAAGHDTQASFARAAGLSQQQISNYEKGHRIPLENVPKLARAIGVPAEELTALLLEAAEDEAAAMRRDVARAEDLLKELKSMRDEAAIGMRRLRDGFNRIDELEKRWVSYVEVMSELVVQNQKASAELAHQVDRLTGSPDRQTRD